MKVLDLFSGIGGFSLGLERAGMETVAFCEIEDYPVKILNKHWPDVPIYEDVRNVTKERLESDGIRGIDVITGGFPCQDISNSGQKTGIQGERSGLWSEYARLISELRPQYAIVENVAALLYRGIGDVIGDLASIGFDAEWHCIPACAVGADHRRDRVWIVAYPKGKRRKSILQKSRLFQKTLKDSARLTRDCRTFYSPDAQRVLRETEPCLGRVADDVPNRVDRIAGLGNAVVPQIPELIGRAIMEIES